MKKWWIAALVLLLALGGCAREAGEPAAEEMPQVVSVGEEAVFWERAPKLRVTAGGNEVQAIQCTTEWHYQNPDGTGTGINACGSGPLASKQHREPLVTDSGRAHLNFELNPDSVTVQCWDAKHFGEYDVEGVPVQVEVLAADFADGSLT